MPRQSAGQMGMHEVLLPGGHDAAMPLAIGDVPHHGVPVGVEDESTSTRPQHAAQFRQGPREVCYVLVDLGRHRGVERTVRVRQLHGIAVVDAGPRPGPDQIAGDGVHRRAS